MNSTYCYIHHPSICTCVHTQSAESIWNCSYVHVWKMCWELTIWDWITYLLLHHSRLTLPHPVATDSLYLFLHLGVEPCGISPMQDSMLTGTVTFQVLFTQPFCYYSKCAVSLSCLWNTASQKSPGPPHLPSWCLSIKKLHYRCASWSWALSHLLPPSWPVVDLCRGTHVLQKGS